MHSNFQYGEGELWVHCSDRLLRCRERPATTNACIFSMNEVSAWPNILVNRVVNDRKQSQYKSCCFTIESKATRLSFESLYYYLKRWRYQCQHKPRTQTLVQNSSLKKLAKGRGQAACAGACRYGKAITERQGAVRNMKRSVGELQRQKGESETETERAEQLRGAKWGPCL